MDVLSLIALSHKPWRQYHRDAITANKLTGYVLQDAWDARDHILDNGLPRLFIAASEFLPDIRLMVAENEALKPLFGVPTILISEDVCLANGRIDCAAELKPRMRGLNVINAIPTEKQFTDNLTDIIERFFKSDATPIRPTADISAAPMIAAPVLAAA